MYVYSNNGLSFRAVPADYIVQIGEVIFPDIATPQELNSAFTGYAAAISAEQIPVQAAAAIAAGLMVTSIGSPQINGVYGCDDESTSNFVKVEAYVLRNNTFPGPSNTQPWVTHTGDVVIIPSVAIFNELATAIANYVALVQIYLYSNGTNGSLPSANVTIA